MKNSNLIIMMKRIKSVVVVSILVIFVLDASGQNDPKSKFVSTAVPFLTIAPNSRAGGMGDAGVATSPDMTSQYWNPAKYAFIDGTMGASVSFTPWLKELVSDINLGYLTYYYRLDKMQTFSASLTYFSLGNMTYTDESGMVSGSGHPNEYSIDVAYARVLSDHFSGGVAFRYIHSDILNGYGDAQSMPGNAFASDIAFYYKTSWKKRRKESELSAGVNVSNIGSKISYDSGNTKQSIPTNLRLGVAYRMELDEYNELTITSDLNRLLVASTQLNDTAQNNGGVSFEDELMKVRISGGVEYWYDKQFAIRAGYHHESAEVGNRKYATAGIGLKFNIFNIDVSYIIPMQANNPLANTIRFTLGFDLSEFGGKGKRR